MFITIHLYVLVLLHPLLLYCYISCPCIATEPEVDHLINIVAPVVATHWESVAINLQLDDSRINSIKDGNEDPQDCCHEVLTEWADNTRDGTWITLLSAVKQIDDLSEKACDEIRGQLSDLRTT